MANTAMETLDVPSTSKSNTEVVSVSSDRGRFASPSKSNAEVVSASSEPGRYATTSKSNNSSPFEKCSLCSEHISKMDMIFQCDQHSEHVICNDCMDDQTCPYCNAPVLERYV